MRRPELGYANVMSTIAVFIALGGTSYAVARNSVGNAHLKRNAVTSTKVRDRSLRTNDLSPATRLKLRSSRGLRGPPGPQGPTGSIASDGLTAEAWHTLELIGGWKDYGVYEGAGYRKDKQGHVHLRGLVTQGNGVPSSSAIIAVLPAGHRPARRQILSTYGGNPDGASRVDILPDGSLVWVARHDGDGLHVAQWAVVLA